MVTIRRRTCRPAIGSMPVKSGHQTEADVVRFR
jgi:hypothetical protein